MPADDDLLPGRFNRRRSNVLVVQGLRIQLIGVAVLGIGLCLIAVVVVVQFIVFGLDQFVGQFRASVVRNVDSRAQRNVISIHGTFVLQHFLRISTGERLLRWRWWSNIGSARLAGKCVS